MRSVMIGKLGGRRALPGRVSLTMDGDPCGWSLTVDGEGADAHTLDDLAKLLRHLRRRNARAHGHNPLTYRELAKTTGWALGVISDYFNGKILPPIDRFDALVRLLGATPAEQGALAAIRDRVEEHQRRPPRDDRPPALTRDASRPAPARVTVPDPPARGLAPYPPQAAGRNGRAVNGPPPNGATVYDALPNSSRHPGPPAGRPRRAPS